MAKNTTLSLSSQMVLGILLVVIGVLFCSLQGAILSALFTVIGAVLIILGAVSLINRYWLVGAVELVVGIIIIVCGWTITTWLLLILGIVFVAYGIYEVVYAIVRYKTAATLIVHLIYPLIVLAVGIILIVQHFVGVHALFYVIGAIAIAAGAYLIFVDAIYAAHYGRSTSSSSSSSSKKKRK